MQSSNLRETLKEKILVADGAIGTYLYQLGFPIGVSYEEYNLHKPEVIADVHRKYYEAGARLIETNTFSANAEKLSKYGLEDSVEAINRAGVRIARRSVGSDAFVVGAVGSIRGGRRNSLEIHKVKQSMLPQIEILLDEGVDGMMLETFYDMEEMKLALGLVRERSDLPVICQFVTNDSGRTQDGAVLDDAFKELIQLGADIVGFNCQSGPNGILNSVKNLKHRDEYTLSVFPNAGYPDYVDGEYKYMATSEYFAQMTNQFIAQGVRLIGGCCGTTPEHIAAIAETVEQINLGEVADRLESTSSSATSMKGRLKLSTPSTDPLSADRRQPTIIDSVKERHTVIVELDPPRGLDTTRFMEGSKALHDAGVDAITLADNSLAMTRMCNMALGSIMKQQQGVRPLVHIACRDRNLIGTQSHMMGLHALGIDHVLAVTGDAARFGDLPGASSVYDLTSFEIIRMIKQLNEGIAFSGKPLKQKANFVVGAAFNPNVSWLERAVKRLEKKIDAGADFIMTQPVYDPELIEKVYELTKHLDIPIFIGIMPFTSGRNAEYLHNEVPGIQLSDEVRQRMANLEGDEAKKVSLEISKELLDVAMSHFNGVYLITPFLAYEMTVELTKYIWEKTGRTEGIQDTLVPSRKMI